MAWFGPDRQQLYFEDGGRGDAVLLLPGWAGSIAEFGGLRRELAGFRVIAADLPGPAGRSRSPGTTGRATTPTTPAAC